MTRMMMNQERFELIKGALSEAAMTDDERLLMNYRITPETKLPPMQPLFRMFDTPCFYRGELVAACGKAKSGKTLFLSVIMAAGLTDKVLALERHTDSTDSAGNAVVQTTPPDGTEDCSIKTQSPDSGGEWKPLRVLWVDTEQSQQSTQDIIVNRIMPMIEICHTDGADNFLNTDFTDYKDAAKAAPAQPVPEALSVISEISVCDLDSTFFAYNLRGGGV